jgi:hypothetical protein
MSTGRDVTGSRTVLTILLAVLVVAGTTAGIAAAAPAAVTVSETSVSDDEPEVGDTITVTPTIRHSSSGSGSFEVTQVVLEDASGHRYAETDELGTLGAGDSIEVPLRATFENAGEKKLLVRVRGVSYGSDGNWNEVLHIKQPTHVTVSEPSTETETAPQLNVMAGDLTEGVESTVRVTASNGGDGAVSNLSIHLSGPGTAGTQTKLHPSLDAGNSTTVEFDVRPESAGPQQLNTTLEYGSGDSVTVSESVDVAPVRDDAAVYATLDERNGTAVLQYRVSNHGNTPLTNVVLSGAAVGEPLPTTVVDSVSPGDSTTATVELNERPSGPATVSAVYEVGSTTGETDETVEFATEGGTTTTAATTTATATAASDTETRERLLPFGALPFLGGGIAAAGTMLGYRSWRRRGL